jgi:exopolysaccharide biosynthesis polyprenyl glycosylphosphotransferase
LNFNKIEVEDKEDMSDDNIIEKTLGFVPFLRGSDVFSKRIIKSRFSPFRFLLVIFDLIAINLSFSLAAWIGGLGFFMRGDVNQYLILIIVSLIPLSFYPTFQLFSYHQIFLKRIHIKNLRKAFSLSLLSYLILLVVYHNPFILEGKTGLVVMLFSSVLFLILSRFLWNHILNIVRSVGVSFIAIGLIAGLSPENQPVLLGHWAIMLSGFFLAVCVVFVKRIFIVQVVFNKWMRRYFREQIAVVGSDEEAKEITSHIIKENAPFYVNGIICGQETECLDAIVSKVRLGALEDLPRVIEENKITEIIVTDENINRRMLISLLDYCTSQGITVWFPPKLLPIIEVKLYIDNFCGIPMIRLCSQKNIWLFNKTKHVLDAIISLPIFLLFIPFLLVMGAIIKWNSRGPVFYKARAIGRDGKEFKMFKFRSMRVEDGNSIHKDFVTKLIKGEIDYEGKKDQVFKITEDPRVTSVGKFIRKYSIDELPQIINVLKGDMSLVGPRPCLPYEYEVYKDWHKKRLSVRPGVTGLWQVAGRSAVTFEDMVLLDLYYIYNRSIMMDMSIIYETIFVVLGKRGAH